MAQLSADSFAVDGPPMSVEQASARIAARVPPRAGVETLPLAQADGRVLAHDVAAPISLPPFANSAVDGYAVRFDDLRPGAATVLPVAGRIPAGVLAPAAAGGAALRIFTGAPLPAGLDTVFMQEDVALAEAGVSLPPGLARGANVRAAGEDIAAGARALPAGRRLRPQDIALAAALGLTALPVRRRLKVAIFSTGDELTEPGLPLPPAGIYDANRAALRGLVARAGAETVDLGILRDEPAELARRLDEAAREVDLILTSGGVSAGEEDHVRRAVERVGSLVFWRIAIKPGRPVAMGVIRGVPFVGLPGNPVAVFVTFAAVARPLIAHLAGELADRPVPLPVRLAFAYRKKAGRREFVRVSLRPGGDGIALADIHPREGTGVLTSLTETDGLVELGEELTEIAAGDIAPFHAYRLLTG